MVDWSLRLPWASTRSYLEASLRVIRRSDWWIPGRRLGSLHLVLEQLKRMINMRLQHIIRIRCVAPYIYQIDYLLHSKPHSGPLCLGCRLLLAVRIPIWVTVWPLSSEHIVQCSDKISTDSSQFPLYHHPFRRLSALAKHHCYRLVLPAKNRTSFYPTLHSCRWLASQLHTSP